MGERTDPQIGPEVFLEGTYRELCFECIGRNAPELLAVLEYCRRPGAADEIDKGLTVLGRSGPITSKQAGRAYSGQL